MKRMFIFLPFASVVLVASIPLTEWANSGQPGKTAWPKIVPAPKDNPATPDKIALGKQLFFDPRLSGDNKMSCAACHIPGKAFGDGLKGSKGQGGKILARNTPTVLNAAFFTKLTWDGRASSLEEQALGPIQSADEMNQNLDALEKELNLIPDYIKQFKSVFGTTVNRDGIAKALAAFQRTLVTGPSPYDRYLKGDKNALSEEAENGMALFFGGAGCSRCHRGPLLSDNKLYRLGAGETKDRGLGAITGKKKDNYKFRTPALRNAAETGPYMHDGSLATLGDVVFFYYRSAPQRGPDGLPMDIEPLLDRSFSEIPEIVAFLKALSGEIPKVSPPRLP